MNDKTHSTDTLTGHKEGFYEAGQQAAKAHMKRFADKTHSPKETRPARHGWAPGEYLCTCKDCKAHFVGDKRASQCADCAYAKPDPAPIDEKQTHSPELWKFNHGKQAIADTGDYDYFISVETQSGKVIAIDWSDDNEQAERFKRIVADHNACAPFTDPEKEIRELRRTLCDAKLSESRLDIESTELAKVIIKRGQIIDTITAERDELKAKMERQTEAQRIGSEWLEDSSLEKWFPITAAELSTLRAEVERLKEGAK